MLDFKLSTTVSPEIWNALDQCVSDEFFSTTLAQHSKAEVESRRRFQRITCSGQAIVKHEDKIYGVFTSDVSPMGIGFFNPIQLFPKTQVKLGFEGHDPIFLQISRCRRVEKGCYECGAVYAKGPLSAGQYKELVTSLKYS